SFFTLFANKDRHNQWVVEILSECPNGTFVFEGALGFRQIAFGFDPEYLSPLLPQAAFAVAFEDVVRISGERFSYILPIIWQLKRALNIGSERRLKHAVTLIREFAQHIVSEKKQELKENSSLDSVDLLSRIMCSGHSDDAFVIDMVISFIIAGRDTTSAGLTWFF
ncbi:hypothetical protein IFM89_012118, partial [Coptis chinensis]